MDVKRLVPVLDGIQGLMQAKVELETKIGVVRRGKLTGIRKREIRIGSSYAFLPEAVILDGDEADPISIQEIIRIGRSE